MLVYTPPPNASTIAHARRAAQALIDFLADPKNIAAVKKAFPNVDTGLHSTEYAGSAKINYDVDEDGKLFFVVTERI